MSSFLDIVARARDLLESNERISVGALGREFAIAAFAIAGSFGDAVALELPWLHPARVPALMCMATGLLGASFSSAQVHAGLALFVLLLIAAAGSTVFLVPGSLAQ